MKKTLATLLTLAAAALAVWSLYLLVSAPAEPASDWRMHMSEEQHALLIAPINHAFRVSAYAVTWAIQLGYLAWMAVRWQKQTREEGE
jgi:hypothetical protein